MATRFSPRASSSPLSSAIDKKRLYAAFFSEFVPHPAMVGSGIPSTGHMVHRLLGQVDWDQVCCLVEYGPGIGCFTRGALRRMRPDAKLIAIDISRSFVRHLSNAVDDRRLRVIYDSAIEVRSIRSYCGIVAADCVLSELRFSTIARDIGEAIVRQTAHALYPLGNFLRYQMSATVRPMFETEFCRTEEQREWIDIPSCRLAAQFFDPDSPCAITKVWPWPRDPQEARSSLFP